MKKKIGKIYEAMTNSYTIADFLIALKNKKVNFAKNIHIIEELGDRDSNIIFWTNLINIMGNYLVKYSNNYTETSSATIKARAKNVSDYILRDKHILFGQDPDDIEMYIEHGVAQKINTTDSVLGSDIALMFIDNEIHTVKVDLGGSIGYYEIVTS